MYATGGDSLAAGGRSITRNPFGQLPGSRPVYEYTLTNAGLLLKLINYGARVTQLRVPDRAGRAADVVLGFGDLGSYLSLHDPQRDSQANPRPDPYVAYAGATIGRYAGRIAGGGFRVGDVEYTLARNDGPHTLHGGGRGFDQFVWRSEVVQDPAGPAVEFDRISRKDEEGFPGNLSVRVRYTLTDAAEVRVEYTAVADAATPVNLTNQSYFNLDGAGTGDVLEHVLGVSAARYVPGDDANIPTGEIRSVHGTPLDFTTPAPVGARIEQVPGGYDHYFVLNAPVVPVGADAGRTEVKQGREARQLRPAARIFSPQSGRVMEVLTTEPGLHFYSGGRLDGSVQGVGGAYGRFGAFCLAPQHLPDSVHHPRFPSTLLQPSRLFNHVTVYRFLVG